MKYLIKSTILTNTNFRKRNQTHLIATLSFFCFVQWIGCFKTPPDNMQDFFASYRKAMQLELKFFPPECRNSHQFKLALSMLWYQKIDFYFIFGKIDCKKKKDLPIISTDTILVLKGN